MTYSRSCALALSRRLFYPPQDSGSQQIGFLMGSCGVGLALTSEVCLKGLPKTPNGEIMQFKGQPAQAERHMHTTHPHWDWNDLRRGSVSLGGWGGAMSPM